ncbi:kynureninase, putative [Perkinsus marinus ATCC 50983]|uniref:Kynureninase, putative n=1 Tax=Perkinsus marinus (strain ATCC 50983 / TXsc) TaxID=423536 RepID=C5LGX3_PERM5|nr:kynureninase, putative [Perkinsus marinus ATCC 50983]EER04020.1 kynureninase, putative [Perkinsus marinus ATCC 50983]|eukprot:XP_002772204.1 kynureninase, putative [Perkinsus marinus ATCC 50983]
MAAIVGAKYVSEIAIMNSVTVNLHLLLVRFYRPNKKRYKIMCEKGCFPSDHYTFVSQLELHGFTRDEALIELAPREGEEILRTEDILSAIEANKDSLAVVCLSGVQYYSGQYFDIATITTASRRAGAYSIWDLAHAVGNVDLALHEWGVDGNTTLLE